MVDIVIVFFFLNQSDTKLKPIATWSLTFSHAQDHLHVFALSSHWFLGIFTFVLIVHCNCNSDCPLYQRRTVSLVLVCILQSERYGLSFINLHSPPDDTESDSVEKATPSTPVAVSTKILYIYNNIIVDSDFSLHVPGIWGDVHVVVSSPDSRLRGPSSSPGLVIVLCSWARHFALTVLLSTKEYKWIPANCQGNQTKCWGVTCDGLASHPGGVEILD